jgi:ParB-like chromosome segregation protein Spo0J
MGKLELKTLPLSQLRLNNGQLQDIGVPKNPRYIKDERYNALKKSISDDPEMLSIREVVAYDKNGDNSELVIIMGNMRFRAMRELGIKDCPVKILSQDTPPEKLRAYIIKDNIAFGSQDWDALANEWELDELQDFGLECDFLGGDDEDESNGLSDKAATEAEKPKEDTVLKIQLKDSEQYAAVVDALLVFDADLATALVKALGLES